MNKVSTCIKVKVAIIGGGPAGTGTILKAMKDNSFEEYADGGIALVESSSDLLVGSITKFLVESDTLSDVFLECTQGSTNNYLPLAQLQNEITEIKKYAGSPIPLNALHTFLQSLGKLIENFFATNVQCKLFLRTTAQKIVIKKNNEFDVFLNNGSIISAKHLIIATGGISVNGLQDEFNFRDGIDLKAHSKKTINAHDIIQGKSNDLIAKMRSKSKIIILGGSHSAFSVADYLIKANKNLKDNSVHIWANTKPKLFYLSKEDAQIDQYDDFTESDICPITHRVFRLAGLRMNGRQLYRKMLVLGDEEIEKRVTFNLISNQAHKLNEELKSADLIIHALGYRFNMVDTYNESHDPIYYYGSTSFHWVNDHCNLLNEQGQLIPNLFGVGLASGFIPKANAGGEPSFTGQTNGLWYYQNKAAELILNNILNL